METLPLHHHRLILQHPEFSVTGSLRIDQPKSKKRLKYQHLQFHQPYCFNLLNSDNDHQQLILRGILAALCILNQFGTGLYQYVYQPTGQKGAEVQRCRGAGVPGSHALPGNGSLEALPHALAFSGLQPGNEGA